jgi:hypothetical protein
MLQAFFNVLFEEEEHPLARSSTPSLSKLPYLQFNLYGQFLALPRKDFKLIKEKRYNETPLLPG